MRSNKDWIRKQTRPAVFYLTQCWSALREIERLMQSEGGDPWDVISTFFEIESIFSGRDLYDPDLTWFFDGLHEFERMERIHQHLLKEDLRGEILEQLRKASWTYEQVKRIAKNHRTSYQAKCGMRSGANQCCSLNVG